MVHTCIYCVLCEIYDIVIPQGSPCVRQVSTHVLCVHPPQDAPAPAMAQQAWSSSGWGSLWAMQDLDQARHTSGNSCVKDSCVHHNMHCSGCVLAGGLLTAVKLCELQRGQHPAVQGSCSQLGLSHSMTLSAYMLSKADPQQVAFLPGRM